jgi:hypothetical protein
LISGHSKNAAYSGLAGEMGPDAVSVVAVLQALKSRSPSRLPQAAPRRYSEQERVTEAAITGTVAACQRASCCSVGQELVRHKHGRGESPIS